MQMYSWMEVLLQGFLISALNLAEWLFWRPGIGKDVEEAAVV
jgi:hypothetical protein